MHLSQCYQILYKSIVPFKRLLILYKKLSNYVLDTRAHGAYVRVLINDLAKCCQKKIEL